METKVNIKNKLNLFVKLVDIGHNVMKNLDKDKNFEDKFKNSKHKFNKDAFLNYLEKKYKKYDIDDKMKNNLTLFFTNIFTTVEEVDITKIDVKQKKYKNFIKDIDNLLEKNKKKNPIKDFHFYILNIVIIMMNNNIEKSEQNKLLMYVFVNKLNIKQITVKKLLFKYMIEQFKKTRDLLKDYESNIKKL